MHTSTQQYYNIKSTACIDLMLVNTCLSRKLELPNQDMPWSPFSNGKGEREKKKKQYHELDATCQLTNMAMIQFKVLILVFLFIYMLFEAGCLIKSS